MKKRIAALLIMLALLLSLAPAVYAADTSAEIQGNCITTDTSWFNPSYFTQFFFNSYCFTIPTCPLPVIPPCPPPVITPPELPPVTSGCLVITKILCAPSGFDTSKQFTFTVYDANGGVAATAAITGSGHTTVSSLPFGTYTIAETGAEEAGYDLTVGVCGAATASGGTLTIDCLINAVTFTNTYAEQTGSLTVTKTLVAPAGFDMGKTFDFTLTNAANQVVGTAAIVNGGSKVFSDLQLGTYTITESDAAVPGYNLTVGVAGAATANGGTLTIGLGSQTAAFTNTYVKKTGSLTVTKALVAPDGFDMDKTFTFTLKTAAGATIDTRNLANGGSTTFSDLELGDYIITESDAPVADYNLTVGVTGAASVNGGTLTIAEGSQTAAFTNTYVKQTGDLTITKVLSAPCFFNKCKIYKFTVTDSAGVVAATVMLKGGESTTICGLEVGTYTVTESNAAVCGYNLTVAISGAATAEGSLTIVQGTQAVTFTNTYAYKTIPVCTIKLPCIPLCIPKCIPICIPSCTP